MMIAQNSPRPEGTLPAGLTPARLCKLRRLLRENGPVYEADCQFFRRRRDRQYRLRVASAAEVDMMRFLHSAGVPTNGLRFYVSVRQVGPGKHAYLFTLGYPDLDVDETEAKCRQVFERLRTADDIRIAEGLSLAQAAGHE